MSKRICAAVGIVLILTGAAAAQPTSPIFAPLDVPEQPRFWADAEYLMWWFKSSPLPVPLVTTGSPTDAPPGAIGQPGTRVVLGNEDLGTGMHSGGRFSVGYWFGDEGVFGIQGGYFFLAARSFGSSASADGSANSPVLANPFFNAVTQGEDSSLIAFPGFLAGRATLALASNLESVEVNGLYNLLSGPNGTLNLLAGFRHLSLHENLSLTMNSTGMAGGPFDGLNATHQDVFDTQNLFYGGQLGIQGEWNFGRLFINATAKVALGCMHEILNITGGPGLLIQLPPPPPPPPPVIIGDNEELYAASTNIGRRTQQQFGAVGEFDINVGYDITPWLRGYVGYSLLLVNNVLRPGDQIDRVINPTQFTGTLTGPARPQVLFNDSAFWAQGITLGLEFRF